MPGNEAKAPFDNHVIVSLSKVRVKNLGGGLKHMTLFPLSGIYAENVATNVKSVPITHGAKERLIRRLNIESHRNLLDYLNQVTTSDVAKAWLSANVTRDWTVLVEALFTEPGLGCSVSGVLPLSK